VLTAIRYKQFKITFSAKEGDRWDSPLPNYGSRFSAHWEETGGD
jgi:hypothetical protein